MWIESGSTWKPVSPGCQVDKIKPGIYQYRASMFGWYLERIRDKFEFPFRIFHFDDSVVNRICLAWDRLTEGNLGVLLNGVKGTGKTVSAQLAANAMIERGVPVILANEPVPMADILEEIHQEVVLFYDEFEKTHHEEEEQQKLLSVLDGVSRSKYRRMYLLVTNNTKIDENLLDRPGRIRYKFEFDRLAREHLDMIVEAYLQKDRMHLRDEIVSWLFQRSVTTVDAAIKTIEEVNAFGESPSAFEDFFNLSEREATTYRIMVSKDGADWEEYSDHFYPYERDRISTLKSLLAGGQLAEKLLFDTRANQIALTFCDTSREKMFFVNGRTSIRDVFTGFVYVLAKKTWMKDWFKRVEESSLGPIYPDTLLFLDERPTSWKCPLKLADIDEDKELVTAAYDRMTTLQQNGTVHGGKAQQFFIRIEPVYFSVKFSQMGPGMEF